MELDTALCACGSGLRRLRCCEADVKALPAPANLSLLEDAGNEATRLFNEKKAAEAEAAALKILDLAPNHRQALRVLFEIRKAENRHDAAEVLAGRLAALPDDKPAVVSAANLQLAQFIIGRGRFADAEPAARRALIAAPRDPTVHHVMGVVLTESGKPEAGERHYRRALALMGREDGMVLANLAWSLKLQGRLDEAAQVYGRALAIRADNSRAVGGQAQVELGRGRRDEVRRILQDGFARWPQDRTLRLLAALLELAEGQPDAVLARLDQAPETLLPAELSARGQAQALKNRPGEAVACWALAKRMQRERYNQRYAPEALIAQAEAAKAFFTADRLAAVPRAAPSQAAPPVFLLGFSRSGTALLEQMLAATGHAAAADEFLPLEPLLALLPPLANGMPYPEALNELMVGEAADIPTLLRDRYLARRAALGLDNEARRAAGSRFVTDRNPKAHWHLGFLKLLFPDAVFIHVLRHPLDVVLSNFAQEKKLEANCAVSLEALARHYDLTMKMIAHYRGQLTLRYLPMRYEDLVTTPGATLERVLRFIGAPHAVDPAALARNDAPLTMSPVPAHLALREPLHHRALYRHRAYEAVMPNLFADVRPIVSPWIEALGYGGAA